MWIIRSKKTGKEHAVTAEQFADLKKTGDSLNFQVLSKDANYEKPEAITLPEVREFIADQKRRQKQTQKPTKKQA